MATPRSTSGGWVPTSLRYRPTRAFTLLSPLENGSRHSLLPMAHITISSRSRQSSRTGNLGFRISARVTLRSSSAGMYLSVIQHAVAGRLGFYAIYPRWEAVGTYQTFHIGGVAARFQILLISGSGVGLNLTGQDLSEGGYIQRNSPNQLCAGEPDEGQSEQTARPQRLPMQFHRSDAHRSDTLRIAGFE